MEAKRYLTYAGANNHVRRAATASDYHMYIGHIIKISVDTTIKVVGEIDVYTKDQENTDKKEAELSNIEISL